MTEKTWKEIQTELAQPFAPAEIEFKPQATNKAKTRALAVAYINARAVMDRLDAVVGAGNWQDNYRVLPNGKNVECALTVRDVTKVDVGEPNEGGYSDVFKSAYSDALKRAAVKFGIGRYLYSLPTQWVGCKEQGKSVVLTETPRLPAWATPDGKGTAPKQDKRGASSPQAQAKRKRPGQNGGGHLSRQEAITLARGAASEVIPAVQKSHPRYSNPHAAKGAVKKVAEALGFDAIPGKKEDADDRERILKAVLSYADLRDGEMDGDEALATILKAEPA